MAQENRRLLLLLPSTSARLLAQKCFKATEFVSGSWEFRQRHSRGKKLTPRKFRSASTRNCSRRRGRYLGHGHSVIADAVFDRAADRQKMEQCAMDAAVPFTALWLEAPMSLLFERVAKRRGGPVRRHDRRRTGASCARTWNGRLEKGCRERWSRGRCGTRHKHT